MRPFPGTESCCSGCAGLPVPPQDIPLLCTSGHRAAAARGARRVPAVRPPAALGPAGTPAPFALVTASEGAGFVGRGETDIKRESWGGLLSQQAALGLHVLRS